MLTNESRFYTLSQWYLLALVQFMVTFMKTAMSLRIEISSPTNSWQPHPPEKLSRRIFGSLTVLELLKSQSYISHVSHFESICHRALFLVILICNWNKLRYLYCTYHMFYVYICCKIFFDILFHQLLLYQI